jgi:hypothetical protein
MMFALVVSFGTVVYAAVPDWFHVMSLILFTFHKSGPVERWNRMAS